MNTFVSESTYTRISVYHQHKVVFYRDVDFFGDVMELRQARKEAEKLCDFLVEHPEAETAPLPEGWKWRLRS